MSKEQRSADEHRRAQQESQHFADRARRHAMKLQHRQTTRENAFVHSALGFLNTEVETGLTLAQIAARGSDAEEKARLSGKARKAYECVLKYLSTAAHASKEELGALHQKLARLRHLLESADEKF